MRVQSLGDNPCYNGTSWRRFRSHGLRREVIILVIMEPLGGKLFRVFYFLGVIILVIMEPLGGAMVMEKEEKYW